MAGIDCAVLFADLSGSTRLYDDLGDARALAVVERCVGMFRSATEAHGGRVIKTIGDEVMAVFKDANSACRAATEMQISLVTLPEAMENGVSMHCGVHWGEVTAAADGDVFGDTVNVAARLTSAAKSGQNVVSGEVARLLAPDLTKQLRHLGAEAVRGKEAPVELHELLWEPDAELTAMATMRPTRRVAQMGLKLTYLGKQYEVNAEAPFLSIGRDPKATVVTADKLASRNHGRIEKSNDKFVYTDFSFNGTFVHVAGQEEALVRRDSVTLRGTGTLSFGRPAQMAAGEVISFEILRLS